MPRELAQSKFYGVNAMKNYFKFIFLAFFSAFWGLTNLTAQTINADGAKTKIRIGLAQVKTTGGSLSSSVKAKDSLEFNLTVQKTGSDNPVLNKKYAAKAKSNGEDIFTLLIEQLAQDTLDMTNGKTVKTATNSK
jgi:hypothetical protein